MGKTVRLRSVGARIAFAAVFFFGADMASCAAVRGWENANAERKMPPPVQELWSAPFAAGIGAFEVEWRGGAKGRVTLEDGSLRIAKENGKGMVVVSVREIPVLPGRTVQGYAACYLEGSADPYTSKAYIRMWRGKENLNWVRKLFGATATDSPLFTDLVNTPPGEFVRKLCRAA